MKDIFWHITTFNVNNALPICVFNEDVKPIISVARARNKMRHVTTLIMRGLIDGTNLCGIVNTLNMIGINVKKCPWTISTFINVFKARELNIFEVVPFVNTRKEEELIYIALRHLYNPDNFIPAEYVAAQELLTKLEQILVMGPHEVVVGSLAECVGKGKWHILSRIYYCLNYDQSNIYPICILISKSRVSAAEVVEYLRLVENLCAGHVTKLAMWHLMNHYYGGAAMPSNQTLQARALKVFRFIHKMKWMQKIYDCQNEDFYEFVVRNAKPLDKIKTFNLPDAPLLRRAFLNEIEPDPTLRNDVITILREAVKKIGKANIINTAYIFGEWKSFAVAIGIVSTDLDPILGFIYNYILTNKPLYLFGPSSVANYESFYLCHISQLVYYVRYLPAEYEGLFDSFEPHIKDKVMTHYKGALSLVSPFIGFIYKPTFECLCDVQMAQKENFNLRCFIWDHRDSKDIVKFLKHNEM